jgi:hypothetical protein
LLASPCRSCLSEAWGDGPSGRCALEARPFSVMAFTGRHGKIVEIDSLGDPTRLRELDLAVLDD